MDILRFYCAITGDDYNLVKNETPQSRKKVAVLATCIAIPVMMWFATGYLTATVVLDLHGLQAWAAGLCLALLVFMMERVVIMANGNWLLASFRLALGGFFAFLGSITLDQAFFKEDIDHQLTIDREVHVQAELDKVRTLEQQEILKVDQQVKVKYEKWLNAQDLVHKEIGGEGLTGTTGGGPVTRRLIINENAAKAEYDAEKAKLADMLAKMDQKLDARRKVVEGKYGDRSLLLRIKAMFNLVKTDPEMRLVYWLFTGLLFMLEFIAILIKMTHVKSNYEIKTAAIDELGKNQVGILTGKPTHMKRPLNVSSAMFVLLVIGSVVAALFG